MTSSIGQQIALLDQRQVAAGPRHAPRFSSKGSARSWPSGLARGETSIGHRIDLARADLAELRGGLRTLSPRATLDRGYAIVHRPDGQILRSTDQVSVGDPLVVALAAGEIAATVDGVTLTGGSGESVGQTA